MLVNFFSVKSCEDENTGLKYAAKIFKEREGSLSSSSAINSLFIQEIQAIRSLEHPNIIQLQDENSKNKSSVDGEKFMILEAAQCDLFKFIQISGALSEGTARFYFKQLLGAIEHCHLKGFAHRDVKLANILLAHD